MLRLYAMTFLTLSVSASAAEPADFKNLVSPVNDLRGGLSGHLFVRIGTSSFRVLQLAEEDLNANQARALLPEKPAGYPALKMTRAGNWREHKVDGDTTVDEPIGADGTPDDSRRWKRGAWKAIATYNRADWPDFIEFAVNNGLSGMQERRYKGGASFALSFSPITPEHVDALGRRLTLSPAFGQQMRLSPHFPPKTGGSGFVILLHDPHENTAGRFETLSGLRSLITANSSTVFRFLVEGAYEPSSRKIGLVGLDALIKPGGPANSAIVSTLLSRYLINTPMAYRLLFDPKIDADAIDDNTLLRYPAPPPERSLSQQFTTLQNIDAAIRKGTPSQLKRKMAESINVAADYLLANVADVSDEKLTEYYQTIGRTLRSIASDGRQLVQAGGQVSTEDLQALAADANFYEAQTDVFQKALDRNKTMAPFIIDAAKLASDRIPIAFIGNFHTTGITARLESAGIGYVVIEPRPRLISSAAEQRDFALMNHENSRPQALSAASLNMGYTAPRPPEVVQHYAPKIRAKFPELTSRRSAIQRDFAAIQDSAVDVSMLFSAADQNASLSAALISSGGNKPPPPPNFGGAFAYFEPGGGQPGPSGIPVLILSDSRDSRWKDADRYDFLRAALFRNPQESGEVTPGINLNFYSLPSSKRLFVTAYDPQSKRTYCLEGDPRKIAALVEPPIGPKGRDMDLRMPLVEIIRELGGLHG